VRRLRNEMIDNARIYSIMIVDIERKGKDELLRAYWSNRTDEQGEMIPLQLGNGCTVERYVIESKIIAIISIRRGSENIDGKKLKDNRKRSGNGDIPE
jgi:hypothetical protein